MKVLLLFLAVLTAGGVTEYIGTTTNQNRTAFVNSHYFSDSYQGCIHSLLLSLYRRYSFLWCNIIHLTRNVEKGGGVLMSIILPNLNHSFICLVPIRVLDSEFGISSFSIMPYKFNFPSSFIFAASRLAILILIFFN